MSLLASSIFEVWERQVTSLSSKKNSESLDTSLVLFIKFTTNNFLAQLLNDADFISPGFCVDIFSKLIKSATHVDIRVAVLSSIISRLGRCVGESSSSLAETLMSALEMTIPVSGSLDERRRTQDLDWTKAEKTGKFPEVYDDGRKKSRQESARWVTMFSLYH